MLTFQVGPQCLTNRLIDQISVFGVLPLGYTLDSLHSLAVTGSVGQNSAMPNRHLTEKLNVFLKKLNPVKTFTFR